MIYLFIVLCFGLVFNFGNYQSNYMTVSFPGQKLSLLKKKRRSYDESVQTFSLNLKVILVYNYFFSIIRSYLKDGMIINPKWSSVKISRKKIMNCYYLKNKNVHY